MISNVPGAGATPYKSLSSVNNETVVNWLPNELDAVDTSTYHIKFYAIDEGSEKERQYLNPVKSYLIAETGVTSDIIDNLKIETIPGYSSKAGTGTSTNISFTITQQHSANLMDTLRSGLLRIGRPNHLKTTYILALSFKGRSEHTSQPVTVGGKTWVWPVTVVGVDIHVNSSGSTYDFNCIGADNIGNMDHIANLQQTTTITAGTVAEFLVRLEEALNKAQEERIKKRAPGTSLQGVPDKWDFQVFGTSLVRTDLPTSYIVEANALLNSSIVPDPQGRNDRYVNFKGGPGGVQISFEPKTDLVRVIDSVLANTTYFEKKIKGEPVSDSQQQDQSSEDVFRQLYRIETGNDLISYDLTRNDYARIYRYRIVLFNISTLITKRDQMLEVIPRSKNRYKTYRQKFLLAKRYDYLFTGKNNQIREFDIKFNYAWYVELPDRAGEQARQYEAEPNKNASNDNTTPFATTAMSRIFDHNPLSTDPAPAIFGTDTIVSQNIANTPIPMRPGWVPETVQPVTIVEQFNTSTNSNVDGVPGSKTSGKTFLSAMFTQLMHNKNADFITIDLKIKGDPYWMNSPFPANSKAAAPSLDESLTQLVKDFYANGKKECAPVNFSQNYLLFTTATPEINAVFGEGNQPPKFSGNSLITAVYSVINVKNSFDKGWFTQELECIRDNLLDLTQISDFY